MQTLQALAEIYFVYVFEKGCFGVEWGGVVCTYMSPKGVCDGGVKNGGWGWKSGQKETPSGQKETPSGQFVCKMGKSALELGKIKYPSSGSELKSIGLL